MQREQCTSTERRGTLDGQRVGAVLRLTRIDGDRRRVRQLLGLGLRSGAEVVVTHTRGRGVVVAVAGARIAVGPEMARHIQVEPVVEDVR